MAANRVNKYGTLFEKIGEVFQFLNLLGVVMLLVFVLVIDLPGLYKVFAIFGILVLWGYSYLQIALIRGFASYFQMRAEDFLKKYK